MPRPEPSVMRQALLWTLRTLRWRQPSVSWQAQSRGMAGMRATAACRSGLQMLRLPRSGQAVVQSACHEQ